MSRSPEGMQRRLEYARHLRVARMEQGLNTKGKPRQRPAVAPHHQTPAQIREFALEAILWMATKKWREPAYLIGLHAYAANLPIEWWHGRAHFSIAALVEALEKERQRQFPISTGTAPAHGLNRAAA